ncbi:DUF411 domain-containing protein [Massilia sp. B-10]|nr:DUF411 domain-containing protein [Massilia sp. B-10]
MGSCHTAMVQGYAVEGHVLKPACCANSLPRS